ncbi:MAG: hypothetical protein ACI8XX_002629, partial [Polaribacter sp.]
KSACLCCPYLLSVVYFKAAANAGVRSYKTIIAKGIK